MHIDEVLRKAEPNEQDRKVVAARLVHYLEVLGLQVNEATGEVEPKPSPATMPIPRQTNVRFAGMRRGRNSY